MVHLRDGPCLAYCEVSFLLDWLHKRVEDFTQNGVDGLKKEDFTEDVRLKCLLWSYRHCCLCGKACGMDTEIAHIDKREGGGRRVDNAIPLCYNCHADVGRYNRAHPRGNEYRFEELRRRREQVYEEHTRHLVPPID